MLRLVQVANSLPASFIVDPSATFQPGMIAELTVIGNQVMATVSKGTAPIGVIDDIKTNAFTTVSWNEEKIIPASPVYSGGKWITTIDLSTTLDHPNVVSSSFISSVACELNPVNGVITFLAGSELNFDLTGSGHPDAIRAVVSYTYQVPNIPGDDSTFSSGRVTVWFDRMFFQTDQFETNQQYPVRANLYVSENGLLTTRKPGDNYPAVGMVTGPPSALNGMLEVLYF